MEILSYVDEDVVCLHFVGDFDTLDVPAFEAHVAEAVEAKSLRLVINAAQMRLINSSAIQSLLRSQVLLKESGGMLAVAGLSKFATSVFETLGIDRRIRCFATEADARAFVVSA